MNKTIALIVVLLLVGGITGYLVASTDLFITKKNTNSSVLSDDTSLNSAETLVSPDSSNSPEIGPEPEKVDPSEGNTPVVTDPTPGNLVTASLSPKELRAQYKSLAGERVSVHGIVKRAWICDGDGGHCITNMALHNIDDTSTHINIYNASGNSIQCDGKVNSCMGFTDGTTMTLTGTVVPLSISFVLQLD